MIDSVVALVEEHVGSGGSRFSESILGRWYSARVSQRNVVVLEFGSPCPPRSRFLIPLSRHNQQRIFPFTCLRIFWHFNVLVQRWDIGTTVGTLRM